MKTRAECCGFQYLRREWRSTYIHRLAKYFGYSPWECPLCRRIRLVNDNLIIRSARQKDAGAQATQRQRDKSWA